MPELPLVSVIIPVWNNPSGLQACLEALSRQDYPQDHIETIVIDNGPVVTVKSIVARYRGAHLVHEPLPASDRARNSGIAASHGDVLAFTDSDCVPQANWVGAGVQALSRLSPSGLLAGRIVVVSSDPRAPTLAELHDMVLAFPQERCVRRSHYGATANLFTRRETFDAVGPFREDLTYGGDAEWGERVFRSGGSAAYADEVRVLHPARRTVAELVVRTRRGAGGLVQWRRSQPRLLARDQLKDLIPPPDLVWRIATTPLAPEVLTRGGILLLFLGLRGVRFFERLRVLLGGAPVR